MLTMCHAQYACRRRNTGTLRIHEPLDKIVGNKLIYSE